VRNLAAGGLSVEDIVASLADLPHTLPELFERVIDRISDEHGFGTIGRLLTTVLNVSRSSVGGCSEEELQVCLARCVGAMPCRAGLITVRICSQALACIPLVVWCRVRCDIRSYLSVVYSSFASGVDQLVALMNRDLLDVAFRRFMPFRNASTRNLRAAAQAPSSSKYLQMQIALAAFFGARARGMTVRDAIFWSNKPTEAILVSVCAIVVPRVSARLTVWRFWLLAARLY
jgi:hypothetical protein